MISKLGKYIELSTETNKTQEFITADVKGISIKKMFIPTKADMDGVSLHNYLVIRPKFFCYVTVTSRNGEKISIAFNSSQESFIVSSSYVTFYIKDETELLPEYLFMYFNRFEFDRYSRFNSWGSARETFSFEDLCDIDIDIPLIEKQRQIVDVYLALVENQKKYEQGLDDLKLVCDAYIENLRREIKPEPIAKYIAQGKKNTENKIKKVLGIGQTGFIEPQKKPNESLLNYKIINDGDIVYAPPLYNILSDAIGCYRGSESVVCSPIYEVFKCKSNIIPEYLLMWLKRAEFKRYAEFHSAGVRNTFDFQLMSEFRIPLPSVEVQKSIVNIFKAYQTRQKLNENLKLQISNICPVLIKGSINGQI